MRERGRENEWGCPLPPSLPLPPGFSKTLLGGIWLLKGFPPQFRRQSSASVDRQSSNLIFLKNKHMFSNKRLFSVTMFFGFLEQPTLSLEVLSLGLRFSRKIEMPGFSWREKLRIRMREAGTAITSKFEGACNILPAWRCRAWPRGMMTELW